MEFLLGALGALAVMGVLVLGAIIGWKAHARFAAPKVAPPTTDERRKLEEENKAFQQLMQYNADVAYGLHSVEEAMQKEDDGQGSATV